MKKIIANFNLENSNGLEKSFTKKKMNQWS